MTTHFAIQPLSISSVTIALPRFIAFITHFSDDPFKNITFLSDVFQLLTKSPYVLFFIFKVTDFPEDIRIFFLSSSTDADSFLTDLVSFSPHPRHVVSSSPSSRAVGSSIIFQSENECPVFGIVSVRSILHFEHLKVFVPSDIHDAFCVSVPESKSCPDDFTGSV